MDVKLPPLGEGADSGTVVNLFVKEAIRLRKTRPFSNSKTKKRRDDSCPRRWHCHQIYVKSAQKISVGARILTLADCGWRGCSGKTDCGSAQGQNQTCARPKTEEPKERISTRRVRRGS